MRLFWRRYFKTEKDALLTQILQICNKTALYWSTVKRTQSDGFMLVMEWARIGFVSLNCKDVVPIYISDFHNSQYQYDNCIIGQYTQQNWSPITLCGNILLPKTRIQFVWSLFEVHDRLCKTYLVYTCPRIYPLNFWPVMCKSQVFRLQAGSSLPFLRFRTLGGFW